MAVDYEEIDPSPIVSWDTTAGKMTSKRTFMCDWPDRNALVLEFLTPFPGVAHPDNSYMRANGTTIAKAGKSVDSGDPKVIAWTKAKVTISYSTPSLGEPIAQPDGSIISETIESSAEFLTLDHSRFHWESATGPTLKSAEAPGRMNLGFDYVFTRYNVTSVPTVAMTLLGQCNNAVMSARYIGLSFQPEQLLYVALTLNHRADDSGQKIDYTMRFSFRRNWNTFWRVDKPGGPGYSRIYLEDGTQYPNYEPGDLTLL